MWNTAVVAAPDIPAAELRVCPSGCDYVSVQAAVDAANAGDVVKVATGVYTDVHVRQRQDITTTGLVTQVVYVSKTVSIRGGYNADFSTWNPEAYTTTLDAQGQGRGIYVTGDVNPAIEGLHITGGNATGMGGRRRVPWLPLYDAGGGLYVITGTVSLRDTLMLSNTAQSGGGIYVHRSSVVSMTHVSIADNIATSGYEWGNDGGGLFALGQITLTSSLISDNKSRNNGGGLFLAVGQAALTDNVIRHNIAGMSGGGLQMQTPLAPLSPKACGGGVYLDSGSQILTDNTVYSNMAEERGGGVMAFYSEAFLEGNTVIDNATAGRGGGVYALGGVTMKSNVISGNVADWYGGGVAVDGTWEGYPGTVSFNDVIVGNQTAGNGSGLYVEGPAEILHTTVAHNTGGDSSGVYVSGDIVTMTNTILSDQPVGIYVTAETTSTVVNGVLWHNTPVTLSQEAGAIVTVQNQHKGNPAFAIDGYHLTPGSAAIDRGVSAGVLTDVDGHRRDEHPDLGADEYRTCWARVNDAPTDYASIQAAVDAAAPGDLVKVAGYCTGVSSRQGVTQVTYISKTITLRGGYTVTNWITFDLEANPTTLDAQGEGRVIYIAGAVSPTIEGLHITGGDANGLGGGEGILDTGGGIYVISATATITNNQISNNTAQAGAGMALYQSDSRVSDNNIIKNSAISGRGGWCGGGVNLYRSAAILSRNVISGNVAQYTSTMGIASPTGGPALGGGIVGIESDASLNWNVVANNSSVSGGGLAFNGDANVTFSHNFIYSNTSLYEAGGMMLWWNNQRYDLEGNVISGNTTEVGGGIEAIESNATLINNVIVDNRASLIGSGMAIIRGDLKMLHNTIARNTGGNNDGLRIAGESTTVAMTNTLLVSHTVGISVTDSSTVTVNGILWHNTPITVAQDITTVVGIQHQYTGAPAFAADGYHLMPGSAAIDRGVSAKVTTDIDGQSRPLGAGYDLGADEMLLSVTVNQDSGGTLIYTDTQGSPTVVKVPAGAVTDTTTLVYTPIQTSTAPSGFTFASHAFDLVAYRDGLPLPSFAFEKPVTVTIHYSESDVAEMDEETLKLRFWDGSGWSSDGITLVERNTAQNYVVFTIAHLSEFALFGEASPPAALVTKSVTPEDQVNYGDALTYTLVISAEVGTQLGLYDPLTDTTFLRFVEQPTGIDHVANVITGTLEVTPTNQVTVSFVTQVGVPGTVGWTTDVSNRACVYPVGGTVEGDCIWSNEVTNEAFRPYGIFLPLVLRK